MRSSNIVLVASIENQTGNLVDLFDTMAIHKVNFVVGSKTKNREPVPFFGINNVIVGICLNGKNRGISRNKRQLPNLLQLDYQVFDRNVSVKMGERMIHLTGLKNKDQGVKVMESLFEHVTMTKNNVELVVNWDEETKRNALEQLKELFYNKEAIHNLDSRGLKYLAVFSYEYDNVEEYLEKVKSILYNRREISIPRVKDINICNGVYISSFNCSIPLLKTAQMLSKLNKYEVLFHNWNSKRNICIAINRLGKTHKFTIHRNGSVKQYSPSDFDEAEKVLDEVTRDILTVI